MVREQLLSRNICDTSTLAAMGSVPRHLFVDDAQAGRAYGDHPLPIGSGQTISQPVVVAYMTQCLQLKGHETVLEIGTGSGYQAAVLSRMCEQVYTIERHTSLLNGARKAFDRLRYFNIRSKHDDGTKGWAEHGPYDAIVVTAGGPEIPQSLIDQLADGGRMIIPVGQTRGQQMLHAVTKVDGEVKVEEMATVRFVDLIGTHGW